VKVLNMNAPDADLDALSDHDLLAGGLDDLVAENAHAARRLARMHAFYCRMELDYQARRAEEPHFTLTPRQETIIEISELWGLTAGRVGRDVAVARTLVEHFGGVWELCAAGQLDAYKATIIAEAATAALEHPLDFAKLANRITAWLLAGVPKEPERRGLVNRTVAQLRRKLAYELKKLRPRDANQRHARAFKDRRISSCPFGDGMGLLSMTGSIDQVQLADYRLTLIAKAFRAQGDPRTLEQLRTDLAFELIIGTLEVTATLGDLVDADNTGDLSTVSAKMIRVPTLAYARPVINVTVPIQTLLGSSDNSGMLSGGEVIPASLARLIAASPDSTWHRMLTDPAEGFVELSTKSYKPTPPIWRQVVAKFETCFRNNCAVPATECELDHKIPHPRGPTSSSNLQPGCETDHKAKHAPGFGIGVDPDGTPTFHTRAGFKHRAIAEPKPVAARDRSVARDEVLAGFNFSAAEFFDTLEHLRREETLRAADESLVYDERKLRACYVASHPEATDDEISYWIHGDDLEGESDHLAPTITVEGYTEWERRAMRDMRREQALVG
jgi:Domain of unknown function (DUF222)